MIAPTDPECWISEYGDELYRYALSLLGRESDAEDAVQETFAAALRSLEGFSGRSSEKTWLFGILKHKIADHLRRESRYWTVDDSGEEGDAFDRFLENGRWARPPSDWGDPERSLENRRFWEVFGECLGHLPVGLARVFSLKVLEERPMEEICAELGISSDNANVRMYRARLSLRECLDRRWFGKDGGRNTGD
ncbi:MAG: sigma-70 family RNA polymerase sigma factor [Nitrospirota bacterium]|nr:sigma-70 family RNA polymerase sigma factor [Nitrospirota bacterium]